jgi:NAD(P)H dehydrogenase (quinone)
MVFPVWWWSMPAILKGWIDRVWNHGVAYGDGVTFPHRSVRMIALAGTTEATFAKRGYDRAIETQLATGILDFCGIPDFRLEIIHGVIGKDADPQEFLERARAFGAAFRPSI